MRRPPKQRPGFVQPQTLFFTHREASGSVEAVALTDRRIEVEAEAGICHSSTAVLLES